MSTSRKWLGYVAKKHLQDLNKDFDKTIFFLVCIVFSMSYSDIVEYVIKPATVSLWLFEKNSFQRV